MHPWLQAMQAVTLAPEPQRAPPLRAALVFCDMEESPQLGVSRQYSSSLPIAIANVEWIVGRGYQLLWKLPCTSPAFTSCRLGPPLPLPMVWPRQFSSSDCFQEDVCLPPEESLCSVFGSRYARFSVVSTFTFLIHLPSDTGWPETG